MPDTTNTATPLPDDALLDDVSGGGAGLSDKLRLVMERADALTATTLANSKRLKDAADAWVD